MQNPTPHSDPNIEPKKGRNFFDRLIRALLIGFGGLLLLFLILALLVQLPAVQNYLANRITHSLSDRLETRVTLDKINLRFFDELNLQGLYIEDYGGDTLLYSGQFNVDFDLGLNTLVNQEFRLNSIELGNASLNITKDKQEARSDLDRMLEKLRKESDPRDSDNGKKIAFLDGLEYIQLNGVEFSLVDQRKKSKLFAQLPGGRIDVGSIDQLAEIYLFEQITLRDPRIYIEKDSASKTNQEITKIRSDSIITEGAGLDSILPQPKLFVGKIRVENGHFRLIDQTGSDKSEHIEDGVDMRDLEISDIDINIDSFNIENDRITANIDRIHAVESGGFELSELRSTSAIFSSEMIELKGFSLVTPNTQMGDYLKFSFQSPDAFKNFADEVFLDADFKNASLSLSDIIKFVPDLKSNAFLMNNKDEPLQLNGRVYGRINRLLAQDLTLRFESGLQMKGSFRTRNLAVKGQEMLNLDLEYLITRMSVLRQLIPNFNPPQNFNKLGRLRFSGRFDGFFTDFVAYGELRTDLGTADMDMNLNSRPGLANATYSGNLNLYDFDLRTWLSDERFDKITLTSTVSEGKGLTSENVQATLEAYFKNFSFKGYDYANLDFTGEINSERFNGALSIDDEHLKFDLNGFVALFQDKPSYNFEATLQKIDLKPLKLSDKAYELSGIVNVDASGSSLSDFAGLAILRDISIRRPDMFQQIDSIVMTSEIRDSSDKTFLLRSEMVDATLEGDFEIQWIPNTVQQYIREKYPSYFKTDSLAKTNEKDYAFSFDLNVKDTESLTELIDPKLQPVQDLEMAGRFDHEKGLMDLELSVPRLTYGKVELINTMLLSEIRGNYSRLSATGYRKNPDKTILSPFTLKATENNDSVSFSLDYVSSEDGSQILKAQGDIVSTDDWINISLFDSDLTLFGDVWKVDADNQIRFRKEQLDIESFVLRSEDRLIRVRDINKRGIIAHLLNFEAGLIDSLWDYDRLDFAGGLQIQLSARDIFKAENLKAEISIDSFHINGDDWGFMYMMADLPDPTTSGSASLEIIKEDQRIFAKGEFDPATNKEEQEETTFNFDIQGDNLPFALLGYFINGISDITGRMDADLVIDGNTSSPQVNGTFNIPDAGLTFDYLNTRYYVRNQSVPITTNYIDMSGATLYDELGNTALIMGGLGHNFFADFTVDVLLTSNRFMVLNTTKENNPDYYGKGIGELTAAFSGDFVNTEIYVNGSTLRGSRINIPVTEESLPNELSFIHFVNDDVQSAAADGNGQPISSGLQFDMDLTVTEDAEVLLIFDERAGDIIRGRGRGDLSMSINTRGDFSMYGDYEIAQGEYLFTLYNIVNKPFILRPGGTIKWSGDPYNAQLDINAEYKGLNAAVYNLVQEYLTDEQLKSEARQPTPVDLVMMLEGPLLQPIINFDIRLPQIEGELQSYTENKLRILRQDQNELNRQVFGLMVIGGFLPTGQGDGQGKQFISGVNTVSEFITNQLSIYLTELISEVVNDVGFISGVDFDIAYNVYYYDETLPDQSLLQTGGDLQNRMKLYLLDDRLTVNVGGNFNFELNNAYVPIGGTYAGSDIIIEYVVTDDRKLKIRAYQETDRTVEGTRTRWGGGISFRHEFDRLGKEKDQLITPDTLPALPTDTTKRNSDLQSSAPR